jgi:predicted SPOUT superfamily RNA methylase MTH1
VALLGKKLAIAIPDTILEEKESLKDKTQKLGLVARFSAIDGVDVIQVYLDKGGQGEWVLISKVLEYFETPQYLRKRLYPLDEALRFAGILPPLKIPSHKPKVAASSLKVGDVREGITNNDGTVDLGLDIPAQLRQREKPGKRVTARITGINPITAELISKDEAGEYWGYNVEMLSAEEAFSDLRFGLKIATSRLGRGLGEQLPSLRDAIRSAKSVKLIFGAPSRGLYDIVGKDLEKKSDFVLNLFPEQKVQTVRTEEAVLAGLNLVSILAADKA